MRKKPKKEKLSHSFREESQLAGMLDDMRRKADELLGNAEDMTTGLDMLNLKPEKVSSFKL